MVYIKKQFVYIRRKASNSAFGNEVEKVARIHGSNKGEDVLRGLTFEEEDLFLPEILGLSKSDNNFAKMKKEYWAGLSKPVPEGEGLKLDISMSYATEALAEDDKTGTKGIPTKISDYILYRYCLVWSKVAKTSDLADASPKIRFYIHSDVEEKAKKRNELSDRTKAMHTFLEIKNDESKMKAMIIVLGRDQADIKPLSETDKEDYELILDSLMLRNPVKFVATANDTLLLQKAYVERCILKGILRRLPNTDTIITENNAVIGNTTNEAIAYLTSEKGISTKQELDAKLKQ